jgi:hypothetical protein
VDVISSGATAEAAIGRGQIGGNYFGTDGDAKRASITVPASRPAGTENAQRLCAKHRVRA